MKKKKFFILSMLCSLFLLAGCGQTKPTNIVNTNTEIMPNINKSGTNITYILSNKDPLKYCDGNDMDSDGFRKTITKKIIVNISETNLSQIDLIKKTIELAQKDANLKFSFPQADNNPNYLKLQGETVYVEPTDGWAGVSIALCNWQPFVEVNLLQIPGVKKVVWVTDLTEWQAIK